MGFLPLYLEYIYVVVFANMIWFQNDVCSHLWIVKTVAISLQIDQSSTNKVGTIRLAYDLEHVSDVENASFDNSRWRLPTSLISKNVAISV